jgi:DNA polymerase (family X)
MSDTQPTNGEIAAVLERIADLLEIQGANPFRVRAYRNAASSARDAAQPLAQTVREENGEALTRIPGIGDNLAGLITEYVNAGRSEMLADLEAQVSPVDLFARMPGVGAELAQRIVDALDIRTLEELEQAAHDGRLRQVDGFGPQRVENVRVGLAGMLSGAAQRRIQRASEVEPAPEKPEPPPVGMLLDVDAEYRRRATAGELKKIAPRRFNPENEAWLPIMHTERNGWRFTAVFSNTARAHELGTTDDWVVIFYQREGPEDQATIVTETGGPLEGKRVVRGREEETRQYYNAREQDQPQ